MVLQWCLPGTFGFACGFCVLKIASKVLYHIMALLYGCPRTFHIRAYSLSQKLRATRYATLYTVFRQEVLTILRAFAHAGPQRVQCVRASRPARLAIAIGETPRATTGPPLMRAGRQIVEATGRRCEAVSFAGRRGNRADERATAAKGRLKKGGVNAARCRHRRAPCIMYQG